MTMTKRLTALIILFLWKDGLTALAETSQRNASPATSCDLECVNGGYCSLVEGTTDELAHKAQAGLLVEKCVCPPGFTGTTCDAVVEECAAPGRKCHNGAPCVFDETKGKWGCDCLLADSVSAFAGSMCRKPITEYCSGTFIPDAARSFCTNGGRCVGDFLGAREAPGDTSKNRKYQHAGCICPKEFVGPHCEFLSKHTEHLTGKETELGDDLGETANSQRYPNAPNPASSILLAVMSFMLAMLGATYYYRRPYSRGEEADDLSSSAPTDVESTVSSVAGTLSLEDYFSSDGHRFGKRYGQHNVYDDSIYNGRFVSRNRNSLEPPAQSL